MNITEELVKYKMGTLVRTLKGSYVNRPNETVVIIGCMGVVHRTSSGGHNLPLGPIHAYELGRTNTQTGTMIYLGAVYHDMIVPVDITEQFSKAKP